MISFEEIAFEGNNEPKDGMDLNISNYSLQKLERSMPLLLKDLFKSIH